MAVVKLETRNEGRGLREWDYVPLSEPRVVAQLIKNRHKCDESFYAQKYETANPLQSNGVFPFSEPVLCSYIDLDILIKDCGLTYGENCVVQWIMEGHTAQEIADYNGVSLKSVNTYFKKAVQKICDENNRRWRDTNSKNRCIILGGGDVF